MRVRVTCPDAGWSEDADEAPPTRQRPRPTRTSFATWLPNRDPHSIGAIGANSENFEALLSLWVHVSRITRVTGAWYSAPLDYSKRLPASRVPRHAIRSERWRTDYLRGTGIAANALVRANAARVARQLDHTVPGLDLSDAAKFVWGVTRRVVPFTHQAALGDIPKLAEALAKVEVGSDVPEPLQDEVKRLRGRIRAAFDPYDRMAHCASVPILVARSGLPAEGVLNPERSSFGARAASGASTGDATEASSDSSKPPITTTTCGDRVLCHWCEMAFVVDLRRRMTAGRIATLTKYVNLVDRPPPVPRPADERYMAPHRRAGRLDPLEYSGRRPPGRGWWREHHVTLTVPHSGVVWLDVYRLASAWTPFLSALKYRLKSRLSVDVGEYPLVYLRTLEITPGTKLDGHAHFHVWLLSPWLPRAVLTVLWGTALHNVDVALRKAMADRPQVTAPLPGIPSAQLQDVIASIPGQRERAQAATLLRGYKVPRQPRGAVFTPSVGVQRVDDRVVGEVVKGGAFQYGAEGHLLPAELCADMLLGYRLIHRFQSSKGFLADPDRRDDFYDEEGNVGPCTLARRRRGR